MIEQASLVLGNGNWAVKSDSLLGYKTIDGKYYPRDMSVVRATTGTRINAEGLIETASILGSDLANGWDFTSGWNAFAGGTSITNSTTFVSESGQGIYSGLGLLVGKTYKLSVAGTQPSGGYLTFQAGTTGTSFGNVATTSFDLELYATLLSVTGAGNSFYIRLATHPASTSITITKLIIEEYTTSNVPRIDYSTGEPALLLEPQRTNLSLQSSSFDNTTTWINGIGGTGVNPIRTANAIISPSGIQDADTIVFDRGAGNTLSDQSIINQQITIATTGTYYFSVWLKATASGDIGKQVFIRCGNAAALQAVTLTANWVRYETTASVTAGSNGFQVGSRGTITTSNSVSVDLWGAQLEAGSYATSYIPTTSATVTRNQEVCLKTGASALIGQTEGTIFFDFYYKYEQINSSLFDALTTAANSISLYSLSDYNLRMWIFNGSV